MNNKHKKASKRGKSCKEKGRIKCSNFFPKTGQTNILLLPNEYNNLILNLNNEPYNPSEVLEDSIKQAVEPLTHNGHVFIYNPTNFSSKWFLRKVWKRSKVECPLRGKVYVSFAEIKSKNDFVAEWISEVLYALSKDQDQMLKFAKEFLPNCSYELRETIDDDGVVCQVCILNQAVLENLSNEELGQLINIPKRICDKYKNKRGLLAAMEDLPCIDKLRPEERDGILTLLKDYLWNQNHVTIISAIDSKELYWELYKDLTGIRRACFELKPLSMESFKQVVKACMISSNVKFTMDDIDLTCQKCNYRLKAIRELAEKEKSKCKVGISTIEETIACFEEPKEGLNELPLVELVINKDKDISLWSKLNTFTEGITKINDGLILIRPLFERDSLTKIAETLQSLQSKA